MILAAEPGSRSDRHWEISSMPPYTIRYLGPDGATLSAEDLRFVDDDAAIDYVGASDHPHEIVLSQGERLVAHCPPWPSGVDLS